MHAETAAKGGHLMPRGWAGSGVGPYQRTKDGHEFELNLKKVGFNRYDYQLVRVREGDSTELLSDWSDKPSRSRSQALAQANLDILMLGWREEAAANPTQMTAEERAILTRTLGDIGVGPTPPKRPRVRASDVNRHHDFMTWAKQELGRLPEPVRLIAGGTVGFRNRLQAPDGPNLGAFAILSTSIAWVNRSERVVHTLKLSAIDDVSFEDGLLLDRTPPGTEWLPMLFIPHGQPPESAQIVTVLLRVSQAEKSEVDLHLTSAIEAARS